MQNRWKPQCPVHPAAAAGIRLQYRRRKCCSCRADDLSGVRSGGYRECFPKSHESAYPAVQSASLLFPPFQPLPAPQPCPDQQYPQYFLYPHAASFPVRRRKSAEKSLFPYGYKSRRCPSVRPAYAHSWTANQPAAFLHQWVHDRQPVPHLCGTKRRAFSQFRQSLR